MRVDATMAQPAKIMSQARIWDEMSTVVNTIHPTPRPNRKPPNPRPLGFLIACTWMKV